MSEIKISYNNIEKVNILKQKSFTPARILVIGFALLILLGGLLLSLPIASESRTATPFIDSVFTSTSAVCVTGLIVVDTASHYSTFGEIVILCLIQIGGLGFMSFATLIAMILGRKINFRERILLQESYNQISTEGIVRLIRAVLIISFSIEGIGAIFLFCGWLPGLGWEKAMYYAIFHSISSFNNAGFDLMGNFQSLTGYVGNPFVNFTVMALIVLGGLGFSVITEIIYKRGKRLGLHSRLVLQTTGILILTGAILIFIFEINNPNTLGNLDLFSKIQASLFQSVTPRTAGYNTLAITELKPATLFLITLLMFIGASPGSTGGGIKTTTFASIILCIRSILTGRQDVTAFERTISANTVRRAFGLTFISFFWITIVVLLLLVTEKASLMQILFETVSAFGTVGLTDGLTPSLTSFGKVAIMLTMYFGRIGLITFLLSVILKSKKSEALTNIKYPEEKIMIG